MSQNLSDDRLKKSADRDRSVRITADLSRASPEEAMASGQEVRKRAFRDEFSFEALPSPPSDPNWHFCWVSTTNPQDPPHRRLRMGYVPVKADEYPGFDHLRLKAGEWEGCISMNEMLLFKVPAEIYQAIMQEFHHTAPNEEDERLKANLRSKAFHDSSGRPLTVEITEDGVYGESGISPNRQPSFE